MKRTFIGIKIKLDPVLASTYQNVKTELADERINWVPDENLHVTLHFLGEALDEQIQKVVELIRLLAKGTPAFSFWLEGLAYFKRGSMPSALFFNLNETDDLVALAMKLKSGLNELDFPSGQTFKPHLTLGRVKSLRDKNKFYELMEQFQKTAGQCVTVTELILFESILKPSGPVYKPIEIIKLNN